MREETYCSNCDDVQPVVYGQRERPTSAISVDIGGPVALTRVFSTTEQETYCSVCGLRVYTAEERENIRAEDESQRKQWIAAAIIMVLAIVIVVIIALSAPSE